MPEIPPIGSSRPGGIEVIDIRSETEEEDVSSEALPDIITVLARNGNTGDVEQIAGPSRPALPTEAQSTTEDATPRARPKKMTWARKTIHAQSTPPSAKRKWIAQAGQASSTPESGLRNHSRSGEETHEYTMKRASQERRKSISARKSRSPVKRQAAPTTRLERDLPAEAGPGPSTSAARNRRSHIDNVLTDEVPLDFASQPTVLPPSQHATKVRAPIFAPVEDEGSWGNPLPMIISKPKVAEPVDEPGFAAGTWENPVPMGITPRSVAAKRVASPNSPLQIGAPVRKRTKGKGRMIMSDHSSTEEKTTGKGKGREMSSEGAAAPPTPSKKGPSWAIAKDETPPVANALLPSSSHTGSRFDSDIDMINMTGESDLVGYPTPDFDDAAGPEDVVEWAPDLATGADGAGAFIPSNSDAAMVVGAPMFVNANPEPAAAASSVNVVSIKTDSADTISQPLSTGGEPAFEAPYAAALAAVTKLIDAPSSVATQVAGTESGPANVDQFPASKTAAPIDDLGGEPAPAIAGGIQTADEAVMAISPPPIALPTIDDIAPLPTTAYTAPSPERNIEVEIDSDDLADLESLDLDPILLSADSETTQAKAITLNDAVDTVTNPLPSCASGSSSPVSHVLDSWAVAGTTTTTTGQMQVESNRSRAQSTASIEEVKPDIARTLKAFNRSPRVPVAPFRDAFGEQSASQALSERLRRGKGDRAVKVEHSPRSQRPGSSSRRNVIDEASRPARSSLRLSPNNSASSSQSSEEKSNQSPSKRHSSRLALRDAEPVYSSRENSAPIQWRKVAHDDGMSDGLGPNTSPSTSSVIIGPTFVDGHEFTIDRIIPIPIPIDDPPPPDRQGKAVRNFDTKLIDDWNRLSPTLTRNPSLHRMIFESYVAECLAADEPESSEIKVINDVDLEAIPPHFEFQYSNQMLYHRDIPDPEMGKGCDCDGPCHENSKGCSCLKRQNLYNYGMMKGFAYDKDGKLKNHSVSIWECGENCGCPPGCMNRVIQRCRGKKTDIDLFKTRQKGWGVRARSKIASGTFLGIYSGELITELESERRGTIYENVGRTYLFDLDGWQIAHPPEGLRRIDPRLADLAEAAELRAKVTLQNAGLDSDAAYNAYSVDAFHYGVLLLILQNFTRFFNHSCDPNLAITQAYVRDFHPERPILVIFACKDIRAGEEVCISYKGIPEPDETPVERMERKNGKGKQKKAKTSASAHVASKKEAKKAQCLCGAWNCDGVMFAVGGDGGDMSD